MPFPTGLKPINPKPIAEVNTEVVGLSPAIAMSNSALTASQAMSLAVLNSVQSQQETWVLSRAATSKEVDLMLTVPSATLLAYGIGKSEIE